MAYGTGSRLLGHDRGEADGLLTSFDFTADVVTVDGASERTVGRGRRPCRRLVPLDRERLRHLDASGSA
jgi:hypothetical protein